ncbi:hypothetical protein B7494_g6277 [Chlorociboria aeruginascens]|nr:hypothetical protein B7494_g6277 [Chlorociboria aeruginascens]
MGKPRMIILVRHGQSEGNKNRDIHQSVPDHRVKLTQDGWTQAYEAGQRLRSLLRADDTLHFFTSPYRRARETTEGILSTLTCDEPSPTPFPRHSIKVYEEPRLREQDFGNFQPCSAEMERMWQERADYGHFFYRIPNGESAADAYDRVFPPRQILQEQGENRRTNQKYVEYFEDLRNINHCEFLIMRKKEDSEKYILENNLRTWSDLKRERLQAAKEKEKNAASNPTSAISEKDKEKEAKLGSPVGSPVPFRKRWGGCPNGCDHGKHHFKRENSMHAMRLNGNPIASSPSETLLSRRPVAQRWQSSDSEDELLETPASVTRGENGEKREKERGRLGVDIQRSLDEVVSSPDGTPSFISIEDRVRSRMLSPGVEALIKKAGRDGGGSRSGDTSRAGSESEFEPDGKRGLAIRVLREDANGRTGRETSGMGRGIMADALGDHSGGSEVDSEIESEMKELDEAERMDKSIKGSVY